MTSNLGSDAILEACSEERPALNALIEAIRPELTAHFQPALLARFRIIPFYPLEMEVMKSVVILKLAKIISRLKKTHGIDFTYTPELVESIASQCTTVESGARNIDVILGQTLLPSISQTLLSHLGNKDKEVKQVTVSFTEEAGFSVAFD
jgi:type VI secretion system protein VasG